MSDQNGILTRAQSHAGQPMPPTLEPLEARLLLAAPQFGTDLSDAYIFNAGEPVAPAAPVADK